MFQMPTEWEQDVADIYVNKRELIRPNTNIKTAVISVLLFIFATGVFTWFVHYVSITVGIFAYLPLYILYVVVIAIALFFCSKYAAIGAIKLYQHYAPEEIRRRCLFKPTCSEYAIMAIRKYGGIIGFCKSYYRLMYLCRGNIYKIQYPWDKKLKEIEIEQE